MALELESSPRLRLLGIVLLLAGGAITVQLFRTIPEDPYVFILPYVVPSALFTLGGILVFSGVRHRLGP